MLAIYVSLDARKNTYEHPFPYDINMCAPLVHCSRYVVELGILQMQRAHVICVTTPTFTSE